MLLLLFDFHSEICALLRLLACPNLVFGRILVYCVPTPRFDGFVGRMVGGNGGMGVLCQHRLAAIARKNICKK